MSKEITITLSDDDYRFLMDMSHRMHVQDNRITSDPIFLVFEKKTIYGLDKDLSDKIYWVNEDGNDPRIYKLDNKVDLKDLSTQILEDINLRFDTNNSDLDGKFNEIIKKLSGGLYDFYLDADDLMNQFDFGCYGYDDNPAVEKYVSAHFTEYAAEKWMEENKHNYEELTVYAEHMYRCSELPFLRKLVMNLTEKVENERK